MRVHNSSNSDESRRALRQLTSAGNVYRNEAGAVKYIETVSAHASQGGHGAPLALNLFNQVEYERARMDELWIDNTMGTVQAISQIHAVDTPEALHNVTEPMLNYIFSEPEVYDAYTQGVISRWSDYTPTPSTALWETVNTGTTLLHGKSIIITEFINNHDKLTMDQRTTVLDAQREIMEQLKKDIDPWESHVTYY